MSWEENYKKSKGKNSLSSKTQSMYISTYQISSQ